MASPNISTNNEDEFKGFTCYWRIENFCRNPGSNAIIPSKVFRIYTLQSKWKIEISEFEDGLGAFLVKITKNTSVTLDVSVSLLTDSGWETAGKGRETFTDNKCALGWKIFSWTDLMAQNKLFLLNNSLTIIFNVSNYQLNNENSLCLMVSRLGRNNAMEYKTMETFSTLEAKGLLSFRPLFEFRINQMKSLEDQTTKEVSDQLTQTDNKDFKDASEIGVNFDFKDSSELLKLFKESKFSFVTLRTAHRDFSLHKAVLCAKSPVFSAMFAKEMKENNSNLVYIDDIDSQTMATFVNFLHLEPLGDLRWEYAIKLYYVADKYQIDSLKKECATLLMKDLSVENVCDVLILADLHQDKDIMNCAVEYFCKNSKTIFPSKKWKDLVLSHPDLISEILCKLSEKM